MRWMLQDVRMNVVVKVVESVAFHGSNQPNVYQSMRDSPPLVPKAVQDQLAASAKRVLQQYVLQKVDATVEVVKTSFSEQAFLELQTADVAPPRPWVFNVLQVLQAIVAEAAVLLPPGDPLPKSLVRSMRHSSALQSHTLTKCLVFAWPAGWDEWMMLLAPCLAQSTTDAMPVTVQTQAGGSHTRGSSRESLVTDHSDASLSAQIAPGLFREQGKMHLPDVTGTVFSLTLAACTYILQCIIDTLQKQVTQTGSVQQCQVDIVMLKSALDIPQTLPFYQDIIATCESKCASGTVTLLDQAQLEGLMNLRL
jgi:hypothetical protein